MPVEANVLWKKGSLLPLVYRSQKKNNLWYQPIKESGYLRPHLFTNWKIGRHPSYIIL